MCCFFATLLFFGPRLGFLVYWLIPYGRIRINRSFADFNYPGLVAVLGLVFVPWTTLMYTLIYPLTGFDWIWIGLGFAADIASWIGGDRNRHKVPGYSNVMPGDVPPSAPPPAAPPPAAPSQPMMSTPAAPAPTAPSDEEEMK